MRARLLAFAVVTSALASGCGASSRVEVSVTDLVLTADPDGAIRSGTFNFHLARPASASGTSGIQIHEIDINVDAAFSIGPSAAESFRGKIPSELAPGAAIVVPIEFALERLSLADSPKLTSCDVPGGFFLDVTYLDEAEEAFFRVSSPRTWLSPKILAGSTWSTRFGDAAPQVAHSVAAFPDGSVVVAGATVEPPLTSDPNEPLSPGAPFLIRLDAAGNTVWDRRPALSPASILPADTQGPNLVAAAPNGAVIVAGHFDGTIDLGDGPITSAGSSDVFLVRLDAMGKSLGTRRFGDSLAQTVAALGVDAAGDALLAGTLAGALDFGAGAIAPLIDPSVTSYYVVRLPKTGAPIYAKVPLALASPSKFVAAFGLQGTAVLGGSFTGDAWIGAEPPHTATSDAGFLVTLAADGSIAWSTVIEGAAVTNVAFDQGDVVAVIGIHGDVLLGGQTVSGGASGSVVLARFDPTGTLHSVVPLAQNSALDSTHLAIDSGGHALITGSLTEPLALKGSTLGQDKLPSAFFAELDAEGALVRSLAFGCANAPPALAAAATGSRDVTLVSTFAGVTDSAQGTIRSAGATDLLVAQLPSP